MAVFTSTTFKSNAKRAINTFGKAVAIRVKNTAPEEGERKSEKHRLYVEAANRIKLSLMKLTNGADYAVAYRLIDRAWEFVKRAEQAP